MGIISCQTVTYSYGEQMALNDVTMTIEKGKYIAVVGANGSGKSTLARQFNALLLPSTGTVLVKKMDTRNQDHVWEIRKDVGMVFQNPENQIVGATVEDDIVFGMENIGLAKEEIAKRLDKVISQFNLQGIRYKEPYQLSGGQKQRVAIAGIIAMEPDVLIFDEATSMLDPEGRSEVMEALNAIVKLGNRTVIHITHDIEEAMLADTIIIMHEGKAVMTGTPNNIFTSEVPLHTYGLQLPFSLRFYQSFIAHAQEAHSKLNKERKTPNTIEELAEVICEYNLKT